MAGINVSTLVIEGLASAMTTAEVEDFGFADNSIVFSSGAVTNGTPMQAINDDENQGFFTTGLGDTPLEMFKIERAQLNLTITIKQLVVSNNILVMASADSKVYKIDFSAPEQIVGNATETTFLSDSRNGITEKTWGE